MTFHISTRGGSGSFLCPPGHPNHFYSITGTGPDECSCSLDSATGPDAQSYGYPQRIIDRAAAIMAAAELVCSEDWVRMVYGYFRNSYSPDGTDRNVSNAIIYRAGCRHTTRYRTCKAGENDPVHAGANVPGWHKWDPATMPPAENHLGYLYVRSYFPEHTPRVDLIESGSPRGYGNYPCVKCNARVQYEAKYDAHVIYPGGVDCPQGGRHEIDREPAQ